MAARKTDDIDSTSSNDPADLAQAYRDLARGEQTAAALESNLSNLENKLDAMLAALESMTNDHSSSSISGAKDKAENEKAS
ncbi:hypothetical protein GMORB2_6282 [Geosmithia morbida]|uniref:Uncharacterized protein n=1 Tax=Geosmithia morbida TaxID=1094350 RepID=A0A9P4YXK0_9HYPO|nr:uncharacterized protein GMORB2_6282 [Geosmithia morbida]KAF4123581.1 hypothetical protein GMORB2_6282 [Geosmithia morbida]